MSTEVISESEHQRRDEQEPRDQTIKCRCRGIQKDNRPERPSKKAGHAKNHDRAGLRRQDIPVRPKAGNLTGKDSDGARLICRHRGDTSKDQGWESEESAASSDCVHHSGQ